jgi:hypothetical protein
MQYIVLIPRDAMHIGSKVGLRLSIFIECIGFVLKSVVDIH